MRSVTNYYVTLPPGVVGDIHPVFPRGRNITKVVNCHCPWGVFVKCMTILISDLDRLETRADAIIVLQILGS